MTILLLEPDQWLAELYTRILRDEGHKVIPVMHAQSAIDWIDDNGLVDLIILELLLGEHNGLEFINELRSHHDWITIPLVVQTTVPPTQHLLSTEDWRQLGVISYLYKPMTKLTDLVRVVRQSQPVS